jgi:catechol 2,3-dioxygenase-like lactoylglutathione lyase family enzyme
VRRLITTLTVVWAMGGGMAWAQAFPPNEMGVTNGHWHLNTRDIEANKKIFVTLGGSAQKAGNFDVVRFPGVVVYLHQNNAPPPTGGTVGSVVNHVGFIVPNTQQAVAKWKAAGLEVLPGNNGRMDQAFVETPDKLRIEILEDKNQTVPIQHHHIHFNVPEQSVKEIQGWYVKNFGAKPGMRGNFQAGDIPGANLTFSQADGATVTTKGRVLDHIGFDVKNLEAFVKKLQAAGVKVDRPYTKNQETGAALAFVYDPWGTYIELNERPNPVYLTQSTPNFLTQ